MSDIPEVPIGAVKFEDVAGFCEKSKGPTADPTFYANLVEDLRRVAREAGYALGLHGSMRRDFDLIAVPWIAKAVSPDELIERITKEFDGVKFPARLSKFSTLMSEVTVRPHGRLCYVIGLGDRHYLDISVFPPHSTPEGASEAAP